MAPSQPITETLILHLKEGVNLKNVPSGSGASASSSLSVQTFVQLTDTIKSQQGFVRQFWVNSLYLGLSTLELKYSIGSSSRRSTCLHLVNR